MHWIDWTLALFPLVIVIFIAIRAQKYVKGVADFLTAGRVAGRYVVAVALGEASYGLISLVGLFEYYYKAGFAVKFWGYVTIMLGPILALSGYCIYRYRETRAMTLGQFLEIRYSKNFRIYAAVLQSFSGILNYAIFPAIGARFLIYFCRLPLEVELFGMVLPTFGVVMALFLSLAVFIVSLGGQITIMVTDCVQGILSYPFYTIVVIYLVWRFSFYGQIAPTLLDRPDGQSMLNPYDVSHLRDFNLFYVFSGILVSMFNQMSGSGTQGYSAAALSAHEQKMGNILSHWRGGFQAVMFVLLAISAYTFLNNATYSDGAKEVRTRLAHRVMHDVVNEKPFKDVRNDIDDYLQTGQINPAMQARIDQVTREEKTEKEKLSNGIGITVTGSTDKERESVPELGELATVVKTALKSEDRLKAKEFETIFKQMRVPAAIRGILPVGIIGLFCATAIFLLISTDTTYLHSWGSVIVQDLILPLRKKPFTPRQQLNLLRIVIALIAVFAFFFSFYYTQVDYILMFFAITGAIWIGGAGPCIVLGLYWKKGTTSGAFTALITGSTLSVGGLLAQKFWPKYIYPWLVENGYIQSVGHFLESISKPFNPIIVWEVTPDQFPINSREMVFFSLLISIGLYVIISLLNRREFNMDRMLHRGQYRVEGEDFKRKPFTFKNLLSHLIATDSQYTRGDKVLAWSVFLYYFIWLFGSFVVIVIWNMISPWGNDWWSHWFFIASICINLVIGVISTIWFMIGGTWDLRRMFKRLREKEINIHDDGRVLDHVSSEDIERVEKIDHIQITKAHQSQNDKSDGDKDS